MKKLTRIHNKEAGFALIVTLMLMILLAILAVGLLSLSSVALRTSTHGKAQAEARANARMALMLAIGDLQKYTGPDTRVTARADIFDTQNPAVTNPPVTGVWRSWEGTDHEASGRPIAPSYATKNQRFLAWLVSGDQTSVPDTSSGANKVTLVGPDTVGDDPARLKLQIHLPASLLKQGNETKGGMAWWVSGENQKARIPAPYAPVSDVNGKWATHMKSHAVPDPDVFRMEKVLLDETLAQRAISLKQADLIASPATLKAANEFYHDLSASSVGLLTNTATGGWKKDLSLFSENQSLIGTSNLPLFRVSPTQETNVTLATSNTNRGTQSVFYPWSNYGGTATTRNTDQSAAVASWNNLLDYTQIYKKTAGNGSTIPINFYQVLGSSNTFQYLHQVRILPVVARTQWVHSYYAVPPIPAVPPVAGIPQLQAAMVVTPVVTLWNPYNLSITTNSLTLTFGLTTQGSQSLPVALKFKVGSVENTSYQSLTPNSNYSKGGNTPSLINVPSNNDELIYQIVQPFTLLPGETKVFSPDAGVRIESTLLTLSPGYNPGTGHLCKLRRNDGSTNPPPFTGSPDSTINVKAEFDAYNRISATYPTIVGNDLTVEVNGSGTTDLRHRLQFNKPDVANIYKLSGNIAESPAMSQLGQPIPFLSTVFGLRMASNTQNPTKGFLQSSPFISWSAFGPYIGAQRGKYTGTDYPSNASVDYSFNAVTLTDSILPNAAGSKGFIVTGFQSGDGLSRCVIAELPTRPLQAIAELQHWDMRYDNPTPPYGFNLIGNSDATPLLPADSVVSNSNTFTVDQNLRHDDSYCANHLLFDDWFFSSIAPDPDDFDSVSGRDMQRVYSDFVSSTTKLPNAAYRPITADLTGIPTTLFDTHVKTPDSWKTIASRLEVEGMFNVNSTSRAAWRAILGHARNQKIPYLEVGPSSQVKLSGVTDFAVSRFSVSGDSDTSSAGSSGLFPGANEFTGYRVMDEPMIDALADAIVEQVRKRGPFLSLSEFVNRQLSSGDLAMAGAIQTALNKIAETPATNPYKGITGFMSRPSLKDPGASGNSDDGYEFEDAAEGETTYGLPGWTRQADILRPLAPSLTARDDTFTIRSYGDARDKAGNIIASAVCEAVVQRTRDFVDPIDPADKNVSNLSVLNSTFGRRFAIIGFRWLNPDEI